MRRPERPPVQMFRVTAVQWRAWAGVAGPGIPGGGPMQPAPLASGGLALGEVACGGWGPHLQYSFLIKLASLSGEWEDIVSPTRGFAHQPIYSVDPYQHATVIDHGREHRVRASDYCACAAVIPTFTMNGVNQVMLAGTLTGVQGNIRCSPFHSKIA